MSYVYIYYDPERGEPIYVGKGSSGRDVSHLRRKDMHPLTFRLTSMKRAGIKPMIQRVCDNVDDELAMLVEQEAISLLGRKDLGLGPLLNMTDGGDGAAGKIVSEATRVLMSRVRTGEKRSEEACANISAAKKGQKYSAEARVNMSKGHIGILYSPERNAKVSASLKGHPVSDETRAKISSSAQKRVGEKNAMFGKLHSAETRQKIAEAQRAAAARKRAARGEI